MFTPLHPLLDVFPLAVCALAVLVTLPETAGMVTAAIRQRAWLRATGQIAFAALCLAGAAVILARLALWAWIVMGSL